MPKFSREERQMNKSESKYFHTAERMDEALLSLLKVNRPDLARNRNRSLLSSCLVV